MSFREIIESNLVAVDYAHASRRKLADLHAVKAMITNLLCRRALASLQKGESL